MTLIHSGTFDARHRRVLDAAASWGRARRQQVWLVGGPVRDAILGRMSADVDLAVERGAFDLAEYLAFRMGGRAIEHREFLTAAALIDGGDAVDVVTTRSETYAAPGALPSVHAGSIEDDLLRRDFAMNAMGLELDAETIVDPADGRADLAARRVRILHERSFIDDPTRVFRALRLATRLGFGLEENTGRRLREAVAGDALRTVSRERLWRELRLATEEEAPAAALEALAAAGALDPLLGRVRAEGRPERLRCAEEIAREPGLDREVLFLDALLASDARCEEVVPGSGLDGRRRAVLRALRAAEATAASVAAEGDRETRMAWLDRAPAELLAVLRRDPRAAEAASDQCRHRETPLPFHGDDLGVPPGPHVGSAIRDARRALALRRIAPDEALSFARARALEYLRRK